jgi:hypothetical protein
MSAIAGAMMSPGIIIAFHQAGGCFAQAFYQRYIRMCHIANFLIKQPGKKISLLVGRRNSESCQIGSESTSKGIPVKTLNENPGKILRY